MTNSLIKKVCLICVCGLSFLGLAKWVGVAFIATPIQSADIENVKKNNQVSLTSANYDNNKILTSDIKADIEKQLNLNDNPEYQAYIDKIKWLKTKSSLRGTEIAGAYPVGPDGHLMAHISIRHRFDYFMTLLGEVSYAQLIALIKEDITQSLQDPAESEALSLLESYQAYKYALKSLDDGFAENPVSMNNREAIIDRQIGLYQAIDLLRYDYFELDYRIAFFDQEIRDEQALIANLQGASLGEEPNDKVKITGIITRLEQKSRETGEDLFTLQSQEFGVEAAQRLLDVRRSRNVLRGRVVDYLEEKEAIRRSSLSNELQNIEIENLIKLSFSTSEQKRLSTLVKLIQ